MQAAQLDGMARQRDVDGLPSLLESSCCLSASSLSERAPSSRFFALFAADPASRLSSTGSELTPRSSWVSDPFRPRYETRHFSNSSGSANGSSSERALEVSSSTCCIMANLRETCLEIGPYASGEWNIRLRRIVGNYMDVREGGSNVVWPFGTTEKVDI